jgi:NitT/TauT family transport system substrate-binding protein
MKRLVPVVALVALMVTLCITQRSAMGAGTPIEVRIGVPAVYPVYSIFFAAKELGYYQAEGLNVTITTFRGGPSSQEALTAGAVDMISQPPHAVALAVDKGVKEHIVALYAPSRPAGWYIMAPAASPIRTTADLNGKTVGITQVGSLTDALVNLVAKNAKINITNAPLGGGVMAGVRAKQVDAGLLSIPQSFTALTAGDLKIVTDLGALLPPAVSEGLTVSDSFIEQNPDALRRWLNATSKALRYMQTHEAWSIAFLAKYDGDDNERVAELTLKNFIMKIGPDAAMKPEWMQNGLTMGAGTTPIPPINKIFMTSFTPVAGK